jgi:radical SAM superfamily enzyme YgiQ (UPF0313 family)
MFPEKCLEHADFVMLGECEEAIVELADAIFGNRDLRHIKNLAYRDFTCSDLRNSSHKVYQAPAGKDPSNPAYRSSLEPVDSVTSNPACRALSTGIVPGVVINELRPLCEDLDKPGYPIFSNENTGAPSEDQRIHNFKTGRCRPV